MTYIRRSHHSYKEILSVKSHLDLQTSLYWTEEEPVAQVLHSAGVSSGQHQSLVQVNILVVVSLQDELSLDSTERVSTDLP